MPSACAAAGVPRTATVALSNIILPIVGTFFVKADVSKEADCMSLVEAAVKKHGADAIRLYLLLSSQVWLPKRFDESQAHRMLKGVERLTGRNLSTEEFSAVTRGADDKRDHCQHDDDHPPSPRRR